jgi:adenylosuccinate lyase
MLARYTTPEFKRLWSDEKRYYTWLEVEVAACRAMETAGLVPDGTTSFICDKNIVLNIERIEEIEQIVKHDVIAFLTHVEELVGPEARWLHRGMTSSDVLDTSLSILLRDAADILLSSCNKLLTVLSRRAREHAKTPMIGRSHGMSAEPITFGLVLAGHYAEINRCTKRLAHAKSEISFGKIAGAVGTYAHLSPKIELDTLTNLGLYPEVVSTQVVARDRHAYYFSSLALLASAIERFATNVRHWQRSEVSEAQEAFTYGQKGSSAMPHKRNPVLSENICGLARIVRSMVIPAFEDVVLWHERDISHSSVERFIAPDATSILGFMIERAINIIDKLIVYPDNMKRNMNNAYELYFSESVLLALVESGVPRQEAYIMVQRNAMKTLCGEGKFRTNLIMDPEVNSKISAETVNNCFNLENALAYVPEIINRALTDH